jgi:hypothetical protein
MKKLITLLLLFTLVGFLSGNQVVITNDYQYIVSTGKTYNFNNGNESNNIKYDRTNKIQIQNNKVIANPLNYHYAFFWDEADSFIGYYKTNKGIATSGAYLGQVNTQSIPLPLNAYSFGLVRYDNDYEVINGITIEDIFIDSDNYFDNDIEWESANDLTLSEIFDNTNILPKTFSSVHGTVTQDDDEVLLVKSDASDRLYLQVQLASGTFLIANTYYIASRFDVNGVFNDGAYTVRQSNAGAAAISLNGGSSFGDYFTALQTANQNNYRWLNIQAPSGRIIGDELTLYKQFGYYVVNFTSLGIDTLTKLESDSFFLLYNNINNNNFAYLGYSNDFVNPIFGFDNKLLNLTDIFGTGNEPNQTTIEQYYDDYLEYLEYLYVCCNIFATQTISFETIYFDDGVSTEIERLGSILIFTLIGFTLMIFGFVSKRRIFNLLAVGAFVVLGFLLIEFVGFIVILFGLIFINVYYTFFGEL